MIIHFYGHDYDMMTIYRDHVQQSAVFKTFKFMFRLSGIAVFISFTHWMLMTIYISWCFRSDYYGIITNLITIGSPICTAINKLQIFISENFLQFIMNIIMVCNSYIQSIINI